jgi:hypothetical protein
MVNLSRPIIVVTSGNVTSEGVIQPTVRTHIIEDSFMYDPITLYPASLTINDLAWKQ